MFPQPEKMKRFILEMAKQDVPIFFITICGRRIFFKTLCKVLIHLGRVPADPRLRRVPAPTRLSFGVQKFGSGFDCPGRRALLPC